MDIDINIDKKIVLCDIDGTLAEHRPHRGPFDEHLVHLDTPLPTCQVINSMYFTGAYDFVFFSGRTYKCYSDSVEWISKHVGMRSCDINLSMRTPGDFRPDEVVKKELFFEKVGDVNKVLCVFDDRMRVCKMWYDLGLFVLNCNQGLVVF